MGMSFSVQVTDSDGNPQSGVEVTAFFDRVGGHLTEYTDDDGWAEFETAGDNHWTVTIYVGDENMGEHSLSDDATFSFTVDE